jgi:uncharacterized iron-regulated membrane protein
MRWLMLAFVVSVCALIVVSAGMALHIWRQHSKTGRAAKSGGHPEPVVPDENEIETEEAP